MGPTRPQWLWAALSHSTAAPIGAVIAAAALACFPTACSGGAPFHPEARWSTPKQGAVVSEHPLATRIGLEILDRGGNAADAAVATALALAVVYPQAGNLGGGGFALWVPHVGAARSFDFRETAPAAARPERYLGPDGRRVEARSLRGPLAVAVPGSPRGLFDLWRACGSKKLRFDDLAAPAVELAREGFPVDPWLARDLAEKGVGEKMNAAAREIFFPRGLPLAEGERLVQPALAGTLAAYGRDGPEAIYAGRVASAILETLSFATLQSGDRARGSDWITRADLSAYRAKEREPLRGWYRGMEIVTMAPPSSGGVVLLQALGILEGLPLDAEKNRAAAAHAIELAKGAPPLPDTPYLDERTAHWWIEALRCAFADRAEHLGDPDFAPVPTRELLSPEWIARRRVSIGANADPAVPAWRPVEGTQTTHVSVLDGSGNAVSLTTTLNSAFGSGILVGDAGFLLNDEMDDFAIQAGSPNQFGLVGGSQNALAPGKRPLSSMAPTVVRDSGHANVIVLGSPGGPKIISAVLQVLLRVLVLDQTMEDAVAAPRLHQQWSPSATSFESAFDPAIVSALANRRGHEVQVVPKQFGCVQAIWLPEIGARPQAVSDPRGGGVGGVQGGRLSKPARPPPPQSAP